MYIYKTTCLVNGKIYIGQHKHPFDKSNKYIGSGTLLRKAIKKHGLHNFVKELLRECKTQKELDAFEMVYIKKYKSCNIEIGYNLLEGTANCFGQGTPIENPRIREYMLPRMREAMSKPEIRNKLRTIINERYENNPEYKENLSILGRELIGDKNPNYGNNWSEEQKTHLSKKFSDGSRKGNKNANFGNKWNEEMKLKLSKKLLESDLNKGENNGMYGKVRITNGVTNTAIRIGEPIPEGWRLGMTRKKTILNEN